MSPLCRARVHGVWGGENEDGTGRNEKLWRFGKLKSTASVSSESEALVWLFLFLSFFSAVAGRWYAPRLPPVLTLTLTLITPQATGCGAHPCMVCTY